MFSDRERVDRQRVIVDPAFPTGFQLKSRGLGNQDPLVEYFRRGSAASHLSVADFDAEYFLSARHLHVTGIAPALSKTSLELSFHAIDQMRAAGKSISFDPNLRPVLWSSKQTMIDQLNALAAKCDWILPGIEEGRVLTRRSNPSGIADFYLERGASLVVIKLGEKGSFIKNGEKEATLPALTAHDSCRPFHVGDPTERKRCSQAGICAGWQDSSPRKTPRRTKPSCLKSPTYGSYPFS